MADDDLGVISWDVMSNTRAVAGEERRASGRFLLRIDPGLHAALRRAAAEIGVSLNDYCARKLAAPSGSQLGSVSAAQAVVQAGSLLGDGLVGVIAFGSWARGELRQSSDIDLLVVVDGRVRLTRDLYRQWDEAAGLSDEPHPVEPHFVHLPKRRGAALGLWAEVAVDGIVLFERGLELQRRLVAIRRDIAEGRIVRRLVHGQPYWVEAA